MALNVSYLTFAGSSSENVVISNNAAYNFSGAFTVEFWIKGTDAGGNLPVTFDGAPGSSWDWLFKVNQTAHKIGLDIRQSGVSDHWHESTTSIDDGAWHHIAGGRTAAGASFLYIDTVAEGTPLTGMTDTFASAGTLRIGGDTGTFYTGSIDDVRIWNDERSGAEIAANWKKILVGNEANLVGYWKFDENTGTNANDESSTANDGTLNNTPTWTTSGLPFPGSADDGGSFLLNFI